MSCIRDLLVNAVDYAGLFPPAGLGMEAAVQNYAAYRKSPERWALGRLVLPAARLEEFEKAAAPLLDPGEPWPLSIIGGPDLAADLRAVVAFRTRRRDARVDSYELKVNSAAEIAAADASIGGTMETFFEIAIGGNVPELLKAVKKVRARAKIRSGGLKPGMVPAPDEVARFLRLAHEEGVAFKATAGLHHALRSVRPLTYEAGCDTDLMHGFLNVAVASVLTFCDGDRYAASILDERDLRGFTFSDTQLAWHGHEATLDQIKLVRSIFFLSFGSCSFEEPIAELKELKLL